MNILLKLKNKIRFKYNYSNRIKNKSNNFGHYFFIITIPGLLVIFLKYYSTLVKKKEYERRMKRKKREGTFIIQSFNYLDGNEEDSLFFKKENVVDIERWPFSHEQLYTVDERSKVIKDLNKLIDKLTKIENEL